VSPQVLLAGYDCPLIASDSNGPQITQITIVTFCYRADTPQARAACKLRASIISVISVISVISGQSEQAGTKGPQITLINTDYGRRGLVVRRAFG
jgi:hypothetical protein